jgi:hypothetical protein
MARCPIPLEFPEGYGRTGIIQGILETAFFQFGRCALMEPLDHNAVYERRVSPMSILWGIPFLQIFSYRL